MGKRLEVSLLTQENFKQFGTVITNKDKIPDTEDDNFNWWERLGVFNGVFIPYPIRRNVNCLIIFRYNTGANDLIYEQLSHIKTLLKG